MFRPSLLFLLLGFCVSLQAQDPIFSQFYAAPLRLNPGLAGVSTAPRLALNYRAQHTTYPSAYTTIAASYEQPIEGTPSGIGLRMMSDRQLEGAYKNTEVGAIYSYDVQFNDQLHARIGLAVGILSTSLDFQSLTFGDVLDPESGANGVTMESLQAASKTSADIGAGIVLTSPPISFLPLRQDLSSSTLALTPVMAHSPLEDGTATVLKMQMASSPPSPCARIL